MTAGHDTRANGPLPGPRRCGACSGVGHTSRSKACPSHPECPCFVCGVGRGAHDEADHRFRAGPLVGELALGIAAAAPVGAADAPPSVVLALTDASGSRLTVEVDPRDGRAFLVAAFDGHESPFELTPEAAGAIAGALGRFAAPVDVSGLRFVASSGEAVKQGKAARETGST